MISLCLRLLVVCGLLVLFDGLANCFAVGVIGLVFAGSFVFAGFEFLVAWVSVLVYGVV